MLTFYGAHVNGPIPVTSFDTVPLQDVDWIDAVSPTRDEVTWLETWMGRAIPSLTDLIEIETSSRLAVRDHTIVMSLPVFVREHDGYPRATPLGFVVSDDRVLTLRFERLTSFEHLAQRVCGEGGLGDGGHAATASLLEFLVDHFADLLEHMGAELDKTSRAIFSNSHLATARRRPRDNQRALTDLLQEVGRSGDLASKLSETLLGLSRIPPFLIAKTNPDAQLKVRLETILADTKSLHEYQEHLTNKTQFLLDTLLGLTNIEQNNVFRVLTVVSVIGIPPTFFASMYGMNFKTMPEYDWPHGYAYALTVIFLSAILPALWFKVKGWW